MRNKLMRRWLVCGAAAGALAMAASAARADSAPYSFDQPPQRLADALQSVGHLTGTNVLVDPRLIDGVAAPALRGQMTSAEAFQLLLASTDLVVQPTDKNSVLIRRKISTDPQGGSAGGGAETNVVQELVVTAQKKSENIQVVPIAISAFTQNDLTTRQVAGGPDLMTQVPNMTFTKTNFSSYSIQIRGIGTQAISATTDPAVAVAFNNTPFVRNRFFEQEFYDLERVEVLRGPQGTLYGRNATAGVVNILSAKPTFNYEAKASADVGNFSSKRLEAMVNVPLVDDKVALRVAGAWTKRNGYVTNQITGNPIDGRDLWSTRVSLRFAPTDKINANLIWEHFQEDDDRLRSGKQLCKRDVVTHVGDVPVTYFESVPDYGQTGGGVATVQSVFSQGCLPNSLYAPDSFEVPNGGALPYATIGANKRDPYASATQSHDLRVIESTVDPTYRAKNDTVELQVGVELSNALTLTSETAWASDFIFASQDLNRFNTLPGQWGPNYSDPNDPYEDGPNGSIFCDPQIGCADRLVAMDLSTAKSAHFSQEFRLASNFDGRFNFSLGANFLRYDTDDKYYVFANTLTETAARSGNGYVAGVTDNRDCMQGGPRLPDYGKIYEVFACTYIDPNPITSLNDRGHNYFLSKNPYKLISYAVFGEAYYNITDTLKLTAGLRWTVDKKEAPRIPTWVLGSETIGLSVLETVRQEWREPTGRLTLDWKPDLGFTDQTLLYASFAHGYKAGGANPPPYGIIMYCQSCGTNADVAKGVLAHSATHPKTFDPEFVNALEVGTKNTFLDGKMTLNLAAFYYDYKGYQISQIVDRQAVNLNFDATVWGLEVETDWRPLKNLRLGFKGGYENTRVADGMQAIDIMDRTAGHSGWVVVKPFPTFPSNCILPVALYLPPAGTIFGNGSEELWGLGGPNGGNPGGCELAYFLNLDPGTELPYGQWDGTRQGANGAAFFWQDDPVTGKSLYPGFDPNQPGINHGEGFFKQLGGNELPNAPHFTATITVDYTIPLPHDWLATLHADLYGQSEAWTRIFNTPGYDRLKAYTNVNLAAIFTNETAGLKAMFYVKNIFDHDSITGAFLFSDDTGLTTNVFLNEPRLFGVRVTKDFDGGPWWTGAGHNHPAGEPYPLTIELGGMVQRQDAPYAALTPTFGDAFTGALDPALAQNSDLDWGDGREVRVTYALPGGAWRFAGDLRVGKTNGTGKLLAFALGAQGCLSTQDFCAAHSNPKYVFKGYNYSDVTVTNREEHDVVDFDVGRDMGIGAGVKSAVRAGLRYAHLKSTTNMEMFGVPDWYIPTENAIFGISHNTHYKADIGASRDFKGVGPTLSWDAAKRLWGDDNGHADLDWSLTGGVLFGKQKSSFQDHETQAYFSGKYFNHGMAQVGPTQDIGSTPAPRSESTSVPLVDLSVGLSYEIQRMKVSTGYRWERYFNAIDGGYGERRTYDRTIDGPYFKLSIGFGG